MTAPSEPLLHLERPAFWTEPGDPESWFRALDALAARRSTPLTGTPRVVADRCLSRVISRRGAIGLFGLFRREDRMLLPGVGLVTRDADDRWELTDDADALLRHWKDEPAGGLERLSALLLRESPWLRLLLLRLQLGDWELRHWAAVRSGRAGLKVGVSLLLHRHGEPAAWFAGLEQRTAGRWLARARSTRLAYDPAVFRRKKHKDNLSLAPLTAPLHLLESVGWLSRTGHVTLPGPLAADLAGTPTPAQALSDITAGQADLRGFVAAEPVLRALLAAYGVSPGDETFVRWMDTLIELAMSRGALELLDAEPGQPRHGRGLHADPSRKLVRWVVHTEFNDAFYKAWAELGTERELTR